MSKPLSPAYLRLQAARCQRLSRMCMDLGTARDLRLMADEYLADAARVEQASRLMQRAEAAQTEQKKMEEERTRREFAMQDLQIGRTGPGRTTH